MITPESSYEEFDFKGGLQAIINKHYVDGDFAIIQEGFPSLDETYDQPAEVIFGGRLRSSRCKGAYPVEVSTSIFDDNETITRITIGHLEFLVSGTEIIGSDGFALDYDGIVDLKDWIGRTRWNRTYTGLIAEKRQLQLERAKHNNY